MERKLAAIMFTDIVGYTALMAESEEKGLRVRERHRALVRSLVEQYHGESIEARGDESLSTFPTALDAVNCALAIEAAARDDAELKLHLGIHLGDVVVQDGEVSGDGVNIASRICALSEGGGICVSDEVRHSVQNQENVEARSLGEHKLKNVPRPVGVFSITGAAAPPRLIAAVQPARSLRTGRWVSAGAVALVLAALGAWSLTGPAPDSTPIRSIAVLPLENLSGDPEQEYFADGMTEALIGELAQISALRVISRTSVMQYKGARKPLPSIARELNVDAIVEGSVFHSANRVRISAQLIRGLTDQHLWAQSYERDHEDVLVLQRQVAQAIAREIRTELTPRERARLEGAGSVNPEAYSLYLQGRYRFHRNTPGDLRQSIEALERAVELDPTFAEAHLQLALAYLFTGTGYGWAPPKEAYGLARASALRALELNDGLAEAHSMLGQIALWSDWDWRAADRGHNRSHDRGGRRGFGYAYFLSAQGRHDEALAVIEEILERDPLNVEAHRNAAWRLWDARRYDRALAQAQTALGMDPSVGSMHGLLARVYLRSGRFDDAIEESREQLRLFERSPHELGFLGYAYGFAERTQEAKAVLKELKRRQREEYVPPISFARVFIGLGDTDQAFEWLDRALDERNRLVLFLKQDPMYDPLRSDPRFQDVLRRIGFPESSRGGAVRQ